MAEFKSRYARLTFYVDGERKRFNGGIYLTEDEREIAVLSGISDVTRVDTPKAQAVEKQPEQPAVKEVKTEVTPRKRKSSGK